MPATVKPRAPMKKALCIGIEYKELSEHFPKAQLHLPAAHRDPIVMAGLLQGESHEESACVSSGSTAVTDSLASRALWVPIREYPDPHRC